MSIPPMYVWACLAPSYTHIPTFMVTCGQEEVRDQTTETLLNPILIIEVLSESTKDYDRGRKFQSYRAISSLQSYITVAQDEVRVEHWERQADHWLLTEYRDAEATLPLRCFAGVELKIADLYEKVTFAESES